MNLAQAQRTRPPVTRRRMLGRAAVVFDDGTALRNARVRAISGTAAHIKLDAPCPPGRRAMLELGDGTVCRAEVRQLGAQALELRFVAGPPTLQRAARQICDELDSLSPDALLQRMRVRGLACEPEIQDLIEAWKQHHETLRGLLEGHAGPIGMER